jgi:pentatricopeptide repeat protein
MQAAGIEPNLVVHTSLIQTCINCKEFNTAWEVFNLIKFKSTATAPDHTSYALMIHACALNGEPERAMDLFEDLTTRREMEPNAKIYNAVIHACAVSKEYFSDAWRYAKKMQAQGLPFDLRTLNVLIQACGRTGHLTRARVMVRHMVHSGKKELQPDLFTFQNLFRAYANYETPAKAGQRQRALNPEEKRELSREDALFMPTATSSPQLVRHDKSNVLFDNDRIPFLDKPILMNPREVVDEAALIINWLRESKPDIMDTQLMNSYLDVCVAHGAFADMKFAYENDMENEVNPFQTDKLAAEEAQRRQEQGISDEEAKLLAEMDLPKLKRNIHTYDIALSAAVRNRKLAFARQVWEDRIAFTHTPAYWTVPWQERKGMDFLAERDLIDVLALSGFLGEAMERIRVLAEDGGIEWTWDDLRTVYTKSVELEDPEVRNFVMEITGQKKRRELRELPELYSR